MNKKSNIATRGMKLGAVSLGALMIAAPNLVMAQDAPTKSGETVVVTGLRGSLAKSIRTKRDEASMVEVVSAEEIGKLPDQSIAESLARLTGIAGQRVGGEVQVLNVRGTSPDFTTTTFNGRQQGSLGDGRGVEVDQYPSELMSSLVVYKTPDSAIAGQGLSGTVDMRSIRPLSRNGRTVSVSLRGDSTSLDQLNPDVNKNGFRGSLSYVNQFMDGKLGVAFGYAHMESTRQTQHTKIWGYRDCSQNAAGGVCLPGATNATDKNALAPTGFEVRALSSARTRDGLMGVIEYKPNDNSHTTVDLYYSKFKQDEVMRGFETYSEWGVDGLTIPTGTVKTVGGTKVLASGQFVGLSPFLNNQFHGRDDSIISGGVNHQMKAGVWDLTFDAAYSKAEGDAVNVQITGGYGATRTKDPINFVSPADSDSFATFDPSLNYGDASKIYLGDNASWGGWGQEGFRTLPHVEDEYSSFDFKGKTDLKDSFVGGIFSSLDLGVNFSSHNKLKSSTDEDLCLKTFSTADTSLTTDGGSQCNPGASLAYRKRSLNPITSIGNTNLGFAGFGGLAAFDILGTMNSQYNILGRRDSNRWNREWTLNEDVATLFARFNIASEIAGRKLTGNVGVQYVDTAAESTGYAISGASNNPTDVGYSNQPSLKTISNHYRDVLPSVNLAYDVLDNFKLRLGAAKQMARPRPDQLRASVNASLSLVSNVPGSAGFGQYRWGGDGGNPNLKPWRATSYDLAAEWYLNSQSYVSVAGFYKTVDTYIYNQNIQFDFSGTPNPLNRPLISSLGQFSSPQNGVAARNGKDAFIKGVEVAATIDFGKTFPSIEILNGFGISANASKNMTNIAPDGPTSTNTLPGFSGKQNSVTAYYEKYGLQVRVSRTWRSSYRSDVAGLFADRTFSEILAQEHFDAQISYAFKEGPLEGLSLSLSGANLTDTPYVTRTGTKTSDGTYLPETTEKYGARYLFGVNYKF